MYSTYKRPGLLDWPWARPGGGVGGAATTGLGGWLAGGPGAGPGWLIENAAKAATFQKQNRSRKAAEKNRKRVETEAETKTNMT